MSVSLALAQTTLLLRDLLLQSLRRDPGWVLTGGTPRITTLPHGKPDKGIGDRLNLALVSALPSAVVANAVVANAAAAMPSFDLRYLVTAHVFTTLHVELLLGMVLQAVADSPVLGASQAANAEPIEAELMAGTGRAATPSRLSIGDIAGLRLEPLRLPALIIDVSPVVAVPDGIVQSLTIER